MEDIRSTLGYISNIQVVNGDIRNDSEFMTHVHDPFALETMEKLIEQRQIVYTMTELQKREMEYASRHCSYAEEGDYPWGTVMEDGKKKVICKCENSKCKLYTECSNIVSAVVSQSKEKVLEHDNDAMEGTEDNDRIIEEDIEVLNDTQSEEILQKDEKIQEEQSFEVAGQLEEIQEIEEKNVDSKAIEVLENIQEKIISLEPQRRILVNAGPGTGKTYTLIRKLSGMLQQGVDPESILVLCFSRAAVEEIRTRLKMFAVEQNLDDSWKDIEIKTFDSFATKVLAYAIEEELITIELEKMNYNQRILEAIRVLESNRDILLDCSHLLVDEIQDLVCERLKLVITMISVISSNAGVSLFGDLCQSIYNYQVENENESPEYLFALLEEKGMCFNKYSLEKNYRQSSELHDICQLYRQSILGQNVSEMNEQKKNLVNKIEQKAISLVHASQEEFDALRKGKRLAILTRTNGMALRISTWLQSEQISHVLQKRSNENTIDIIIARIFRNYEYETIDRNDFIEAFEIADKTHELDADYYWRIVENTQKGKKGRYHVEEILKSAFYRKKIEKLYVQTKNNEIVVSNIHRAKGKEYDTVILLNDILKSDLEEDLQEHKVCYVALTRAKKQIYQVDIQNQYISICKQDGRAYEKKRDRKNKKLYASCIEFGRENDIDKHSFGEYSEAQDYIDSVEDLIGKSVLLRRNRSITAYIAYDIFLEGEEKDILLGRTSAEFSKSLTDIIMEAKNITGVKEVYDCLFPSGLTDLYITGAYTEVGYYDKKLKGAKSFGEMMIWNSLHIDGFARFVRDKY